MLDWSDCEGYLVQHSCSTELKPSASERHFPRNWKMFVRGRALGTCGDFSIKEEKENLISFLELHLKYLGVHVSSFHFFFTFIGNRFFFSLNTSQLQFPPSTLPVPSQLPSHLHPPSFCPSLENEQKTPPKKKENEQDGLLRANNKI